MPLSGEDPRTAFLSLRAWRTRLAFWAGGALLGAAAVAFAVGAEHANAAFRLVVERWPWAPVLMTPLGLAAVAWATKRWFAGTEGSGIPQAMAALEMYDGAQRARLLSLRAALGKIGLTLAGMLCGASIGREGPTVHVGAGILYSIRGLVPQPRHEIERGLILAGGAAGIAAAFNTPLAGLIFAIEELSRSFEERTNGIILVAVIVAGLASLVLQGPYTYFGQTPATLPPTLEGWLAVPVCGVVGGLLGGVFSRGLIWGTRHLPRPLAARPVLLAALAGAGLVAVGFASGHTAWGTGYEEARRLVDGAAAADPTYPFWKMAATWLSYLSGIPGGIFAPSLSVGAGLGADIAHWFPATPAAAVVILGMAGYFTGVVQTPITALVIIMEMTAGSGLVLPLMTTAFIAYGTSRLVCPEPIYRALARTFLERQPPPPEQEAGAGADGPKGGALS